MSMILMSFESQLTRAVRTHLKSAVIVLVCDSQIYATKNSIALIAIDRTTMVVLSQRYCNAQILSSSANTLPFEGIYYIGCVICC